MKVNKNQITKTQGLNFLANKQFLCVQGYRILFKNFSKDTGYCSQICPRIQDTVHKFVQGYRILFTNLSKDGYCSNICPRIPDTVHKFVQGYRMLCTNLSKDTGYCSQTCPMLSDTGFTNQSHGGQGLQRGVQRGLTPFKGTYIVMHLSNLPKYVDTHLSMLLKIHIYISQHVVSARTLNTYLYISACMQGMHGICDTKKLRSSKYISFASLLHFDRFKSG